VVDQVFDLFVKLNAPDHLLDFPVVYASAKEGYAKHQLIDQSTDMAPISELIVSQVQAPGGDPEATLQMQVSSLDHSPYLGRLGIGKVTNGTFTAVGTPQSFYVVTLPDSNR